MKKNSREFSRNENLAALCQVFPNIKYWNDSDHANVIQENSNDIVVMYKCHGYHTKSGNAVSYVRFTEGFASQQFPRNDILRVLRVSVKSIGVKLYFRITICVFQIIFRSMPIVFGFNLSLTLFTCWTYSMCL